MLVFASEFPLKKDSTTAQIMDICRDWIVKSPHYPWTSGNNLTWEPNEIKSSSLDGQTLDLGMYIGPEIESFGLRHKWIENDSREWTTEISSINKTEYRWLSVKIYIEDFVPGLLPPSPKKPYILKQLFSTVGGGKDGLLTVQDTPHFFKEKDIEIAAQIIKGDIAFDLPILYVSSNFDERPFIDVDTTAKWLSGVAHVVVEPNRLFSLNLSQIVDKINPYGGAISIIWPGRQGKSYKLLPFNYSSSREMVLEAQEILRGAWLYTKSENDCSWSDLQQLTYQAKLLNLKSSSSTSLDDYMEAFDGENKALEEKVRQLESRLSSAQHALQNLHSTSNSSNSILISKGKEQDLYSNEIQDCILASLDENLERMNPNSRRSHVIQSIVQSNNITSTRAHIESEIRRIISKASKITSSEISGLRDLGFTVESGGKHPTATFNGDPRYSFTMFSTASDHRAGDNLASDILKILIKP